MRALLVALASLAVITLSACAAGRPSLGNIQLRPYTQIVGIPEVFSVQSGRILNPNLDLSVEDDGCVRGEVRRSLAQLCSQEKKAEPREEGGKVEHWAGVGGDVTLELFDKGTRLRMDGYLRGAVGGGTLPVEATVLLGQGPEWDELRKHPVLLAVAAAYSGVRGEPMEHQRP